MLCCYSNMASNSNIIFTSDITYLMERALINGVPINDIVNICSSEIHKGIPSVSIRSKICTVKKASLFFIIILSIAISKAYLPDIDEVVSDVVCSLENVETPILSSEMTRPMFNCSLCEHLINIPLEYGLTQAKFEKLYAFSGVPAVVKGAAQNWTAQQFFSVKYFKEVYSRDEESFKKFDESCAYLRYATEWYTLEDALNMSEDRASFKEGSWYIGWSNCIENVESELRRHYVVPDFLPNIGNAIALDWIFMGGFGKGAPIHLDNVGRPSWQAQIRGKKTWFLEPSPECQHVCHPMSVVMAPGDIIALDTDVWYHSTFIHEGDISITIGSEYD